MRNLKGLGLTLGAVAAAALCTAGAAPYIAQAQRARLYTLEDAYSVLKRALHVPGTAEKPWHDIDGNGNVTLDDAKLCLQYALKVKVPDASATPPPTPTQTGGDVGGSVTPTPTHKPSDTEPPKPGETTAPTPAPGLPDISGTCVSTDHVTLYTGNNATGNDYASVTIYNVTEPTDITYCFPAFEDNKIWLREGKDSSDWIYVNEALSVVPTIAGNSVTYDIYLTDNVYDSGWDDLISGTSSIYFYLDPDDDDGYFKVDVTIERNHTDTTYYPIMDEYYINVGAVSNDAAISDPSMCTTDAAIIVEGMNRLYGTHVNWNIPQDGSMYVTGPCVITEQEVNTEKHYTISHEKKVEEVYLETMGKYDDEMTKAVEQELKKHTIWYLGNEANCPCPKAYCDFIYDTIDSWYRGKISYRHMRNTLRYTQFYDGNKCTNGGAVSKGAKPEYFPINDTNGTIAGHGKTARSLK